MRKYLAFFVILSFLVGIVLAQEPTTTSYPDILATGGVRHYEWKGFAGPIIRLPAPKSRTIIPVKNNLNWSSFLQSFPPIRFVEADGSPDFTQPNKLVWPNGSLSRSGSTLTISFTGAGLISGSGTIGTIPKFTAAQTIGNSLISESGSNVTVNGVLLPNAAGTRDFGSATLPYATIFFAGTSGTPGTNNFQFTGASTSGTRVITFPDSATKVPIASQFLTFSGPSAARTFTVADASTTLVTAASALTANQLVLGAGSGTTAVLGSLGTTNTLLHGNAAGAPTFAAVDLTADVTGILPTANGGTANAFFTVSGPATTPKTFTFPNASSTVATGTGTNNTVPKFTTGASGIIGDSSLTDDGTTATFGSVLKLPAGSASLPSLYFSTDSTTGFYRPGANIIDVTFGGTAIHRLQSSAVIVGGDLRFGTAAASNVDTILLRDASNTLAQRNGTTAQITRIYNTFTSSTNFERATLNWTSNIFNIQTAAGSAGGTIRALLVGAGAAVGTDQAGATTTVVGGVSTGTGAGGSILFQTSAAAGASSATANTLATALTIDSTKLATFAGGVNITALTTNSLVYSAASGALTSLGAATNGQIPIGSTGAAPVLGTITGTANQVTVTNGAGSVTLSTPQSIATTSTPTFGGITIGSGGGAITKILTGTASLDFGATAAGTCDSLTITVTGAADGDTVFLGIPNALAASDTYQTFEGFVSSAGVVTVKRCNLTNLTTALSNPAAATVRATVVQY